MPMNLDPIPQANSDSEANPPPDRLSEPLSDPSNRSERAPSRLRKGVAIAAVVLLCALHGLGIWSAMGGRAGLTNSWPLWRNDHPLYYHSALVTRSFLKDSWTTAGYDPSFMAGYAKSVIFPASSTLPELVIAAFGGDHPVFAYKLYVLISAAAVPWLIALACACWSIPPRAAVLTIVLELIYVWTDFPIRFVELGMVPYFLAIPLSLLATGAFARFLSQGGALNWLISTVLLSMAFLVHFTTAMVMVPAAALAYLAVAYRNRGIERLHRAQDRSAAIPRPPSADPAGSMPARRFTAWSHAAVWLIPVVVLAVNAFWWLPGLFLTATKGASDFAYYHPEGALNRFIQIITREPQSRAFLWERGFRGSSSSSAAIRSAAGHWSVSAAPACSGAIWRANRGALDFLQPGRHTFALYTALSVAAGRTLDELLKRLRIAQFGVDRFDRWVMAGVVLIGSRMLSQAGGYPALRIVQARTGVFGPTLPSEPPARLLWIVDRLKRHVHPGARLLYEEGGFGDDPFEAGRFSGLLPERTGVEIIGGPYLHASLTTNFTQFGEGKLCGKAEWTSADFIRYAKLYVLRPYYAGVRMRVRFCKENPDLVEVLDDDGTVLIGRDPGIRGRFH